MIVRIAENAGFCFGVKRAYNIADTASVEATHYTLGEIVHNKQVRGVLEGKGIIKIDNLDDAKGKGNIIIRAHGVPKSVIKDAIKKGLGVLDATCPYVKRVQDRAIELEAEGYFVVILGESDHPEVKGITGNIKNFITITSIAEAEKIDAEKIGLIAQTTQKRELFFEIENILKDKCKEFKSFDTICAATAERQGETRKLAKEVDVMLIVGDRGSGNTMRLFEISREENEKSFWVETADDLEKSWFGGVNSVGISAGASTPDFTIEEVSKKVSEYGS